MSIIRKPLKSIGNYLGPYVNRRAVCRVVRFLAFSVL